MTKEELRSRWFEYHREQWIYTLMKALSWTHTRIRSPGFNYKTLVLNQMLSQYGRMFDVGELL